MWEALAPQLKFETVNKATTIILAHIIYFQKVFGLVIIYWLSFLNIVSSYKHY